MTSIPPQAAELAAEEYRSLRATIRERGTLRLAVSAFTFAAWATLALLVSPAALPGTTLIPLMALWAGFEVVLAAHIGVERVGRYLQARYEPAPPALPAWEHTAMGLGRVAAAATGSDPLLVRLFTLSALLNLLPLVPASLDRTPTALVTVHLAVGILLHVAFLLRVAQGRRFARNQRARDLALFTPSS